MFSNVKTSDPMDADARNAVTDTGGKRAEVTPAARAEPGISVRTGISTFCGNLLLFMFEGIVELPSIVTTPCGRLYILRSSYQWQTLTSGVRNAVAHVCTLFVSPHVLEWYPVPL
jgi:hypothetical protein